MLGDIFKRFNIADRQRNFVIFPLAAEKTVRHKFYYLRKILFAGSLFLQSIKNHKFKAGIFFLFAWYFFNNTAIFRSLFPNFNFYFNLTKSAEKQF